MTETLQGGQQIRSQQPCVGGGVGCDGVSLGNDSQSLAFFPRSKGGHTGCTSFFFTPHNSHNPKPDASFFVSGSEVLARFFVFAHLKFDPNWVCSPFYAGGEEGWGAAGSQGLSPYPCLPNLVDCMGFEHFNFCKP